MRIDYLSASEIPSRTGNSVHVMKMCNALGAQGHEVVLYARRGYPAKDDPYARYGVQDTFPIIFFPWPRLRVVGPLIYVWCVFFRLLRSPRPDLFYSRYVYLIFLASFLGVPCIYEAHVFPAGPIARLVEALLMRRRTFRRLVVISDALRRDYLKAYPSLGAGRMIVAHDSADIPHEKFDKPAGKPGDRETAGLQIGYVGQLYPGKGMEIVSQLAPRFPALTFHVVGGRDEDLDFWKERTGFPNLIFHGYVNPGDIGRYYRQFDIMLVPFLNKVTLEGGQGDISRWTSPLKVFEYMAHGKAIISSDLPVLREVLQNGATAVMVPPDINAWVVALKDLVQDRALMERLGCAARRLLEEEYTWDRRVVRVLS